MPILHKQILEGSRAIAEVIKNIEPDVVSAYPITPQTHIVEDLATFKANGEADYEYILAESEFAAASIVLGASATGARVYSATSSQGLLLMTEVIYNIAGMRLPIVMTCANRAISAPINIWCFSKETKVLMSDLTYKPINKIEVGDSVLGKDKNGKLVYSIVKKLFSRQTNNLVKIKSKEAEILCTPEHQFYYHSGHDHWTKAANLKGKSLHYFGYKYEINDEFKKGWLSGVADGDGSFYSQNKAFAFRLKCKDEEMAKTFIEWSNHFNFPVRKADYMEKFGYFIAILTLTKKAKDLQEFLIKKTGIDFARGYLAGIYDAEGSGPFKVKQAVIYNNDTKIVKTVETFLKMLDIKFKTYKDARRGEHRTHDNYHVKINTVPEFFIKCPPRISRKRNNLLRMSIKSIKSRTKIIDVAPIEQKTKVYNIETETNNYIANGLLVHNCDHSDTMSIRDAGWIQLFAASTQEAIEQHILAYKIAEKLKLPVMVNVDGFILTHSYEAVTIPTPALIRKYLPVYEPTIGEYLNPHNPVTLGAFFTPEYYMETRENLHRDLNSSLAVIKKEYELLKNILKTEYLKEAKNNKPTKSLKDIPSINNGLIEYYGAKNPETIIVALGSMVGTILETIRSDKQFAKSVGLLKIKVYRPFPAEEIIKVISRTKNIAVIEKAISLGQAGPLYSDLKAALSENKFNISNYIVGLGGRDVTSKIIKEIIKKAKRKNQPLDFCGKI